MALILVIVVIALLLALPISHSWLFKTRIKPKKFPPGPKGIPIFGCLHLLGKLPHRNLHKLSQKYGPIMSMKLGLVPTIIVSSPQAAKLFLKTHDLIFASRPSSQASKHISYQQQNLVFAPYGPYWRNMRKMCTLELLSNHKINSFMPIRKHELGLLIEYFKEAAHNKTVVNLSAKVTSLTTDIICLMAFGKKYGDEDFDERGFKAVIQEGMQLAAAPNLGDFIPAIAWLDLQGFTRKMKSVHKVYDEFLEKIINEHLVARGGKKTRDFVDVMLDLIDSQQTEYQIDRSTIKAIMLDMLAAAMDTSSTTIGWAMSELIRQPDVMKKMQSELQKVVGLDRMVEESDLVSLEYLEMVVKEIMRLYPAGPLLIPHESLEDCTVNGFHIPKKSRLIVNAWAIGRDPSVWNDPHKFFPERFIGSQIDLKGKDFELIPFGAGRRGCPGMQLGLTMVRLLLAQLVHCFDWELPNGMLPSELDMTEEFGLTCPRAQDLMVIPTFRLYNSISTMDLSS
ncbi:cytochrome P450 CYP736A12-like protein [Cucumis melo var. makuwa]|uniref:Cytochrome P450 CYP736A12-like protein n=2 Tax=Cucumis melo TaxID=3656 RepID=A0A5A7SY99_CUCMM|nr:cytochrome P450 CYP736A12-like protein [Cucumis melo var. makuwa]TYK12658.1 cytochrome P450 CYP736A12-like protein [Cucumis melo var. makuwa]